MTRILEYSGKAVSGLQRYLSANTLVVIFFAILIAFWLWEKKQMSEAENRLLVYSLLMTVFLCVPVSAVFVMIYQTPFYDYEWAWSMVPVTALTAYGLTVFMTQKKLRIKKWIAGLLITGLVILCGNQGLFQKVSPAEMVVRENVDEVLQGIHSYWGKGDVMVWAPHLLMQEIRRQDGSIKLVYGRDMWDEKAGAYDYEAYPQEVTDAYLWMGDIARYGELAETMEKPADTMQLLVKEYKLLEEAEKSLETMIATGANTIVFPNIVSTYLEGDVHDTVRKCEKELQVTYTEQYVIYFLD